MAQVPLLENKIKNQYIKRQISKKLWFHLWTKIQPVWKIENKYVSLAAVLVGCHATLSLRRKKRYVTSRTYAFDGDQDLMIWTVVILDLESQGPLKKADRENTEYN